MTQLEQLLFDLRVTIRCKYGELGPGFRREDWPQGVHPYRVTLRMGERRLTTHFYMGPAHELKDPTAADVLYCLCSDARLGEQSFEDFCSELGAEEDSRAVYATWKACTKIAPRVRKLLGEHFEEVANAEH